MKFDNETIEFSNTDLRQGIILPEVLTAELSEFVGIVLGDGHIYTKNNRYRVGVTGDLITDKDYFLYIQKLIKKLWNKDVNIRLRKKCRVMVANSKAMVLFLLNAFNCIMLQLYLI